MLNIDRTLSPSHANPLYCPTCIAMFAPAGFAALWTTGYKHLDARTCSLRASEGCKLCRLILGAASSGYRDAQTEPLVFKASCSRASPTVGEMSVADAGKQTVGIPISLDTLDAQVFYRSNMFTCQLAVYTYDDDPLNIYFPGRPLADMTSDTVVRAARGWLQNCKSNHMECGNVREKPILPTRVLDVGIGDDQRAIRLHVSSRNQRDDYAALSYCWGGPQPLTTTTKNIVNLTTEIPELKLPQTLMDAVTVTRSLGIRYLWIDALCIIQDSIEDKSHQIQDMGNVYKNATVTIMAGASRSAAEGFLSSKAQQKQTCELEISIPNGVRGFITITPITFGAYNFLPHSKRAWCFQEYMLSSRHLLFTNQELVWQCRTLDHATVSVGSVRYPSRVDRVPFGMFQVLPDEYAPKQEGKSRRQELWSTVLENYTRREMMSSADRLNALTGVINELQVLWRDTCIFGIWQGRFIEELAWTVTGMAPEGLDQRTGHAPTWSWVSLGSPTQISSGWLENVSDSQLVSFSDNYTQVTVRGNTLSSDQIQVVTERGLYNKNQPWGSVETDLDEQDVPSVTLFLLLGYDDDSSFALALTPSGVDHYERIGLATFDRRGDSATSLWSQAIHRNITIQ